MFFLSVPVVGCRLFKDQWDVLAFFAKYDTAEVLALMFYASSVVQF